MTDIALTVRQIVARHTDRATTDVAEDASFESLSIDSFMQMEIILDVEDALSLSIPDRRVDDFQTLADLIAECRTQRGLSA